MDDYAHDFQTSYAVEAISYGEPQADLNKRHRYEILANAINLAFRKSYFPEDSADVIGAADILRYRDTHPAPSGVFFVAGATDPPPPYQEEISNAHDHGAMARLDPHPSSPMPPGWLPSDWSKYTMESQWHHCARCNMAITLYDDDTIWRVASSRRVRHLGSNVLEAFPDPVTPLTQWMRGWYHTPPSIHWIQVKMLDASQVVFCVLLNGAIIQIPNAWSGSATAQDPSGPRGNLLFPEGQARLLRLLQTAFLNAGLYVTPLELAIWHQPPGKREFRFTNLSPLNISGETLVGGFSCHRFLIPLKVSQFRSWTPAQVQLYCDTHDPTRSGQRAPQQIPQPRQGDSDNNVPSGPKLPCTAAALQLRSRLKAPLSPESSFQPGSTSSPGPSPSRRSPSADRVDLRVHQDLRPSPPSRRRSRSPPRRTRMEPPRRLPANFPAQRGPPPLFRAASVNASAMWSGVCYPTPDRTQRDPKGPIRPVSLDRLQARR
jgi:hypothetical protein